MFHPYVHYMHTKIWLHRHLVVNFMSPFLKLGNCIKFCVIPIKVLYKLDLSKFVVKFSHSFLMSKVNVDMSPFPSFLYMN